MSVLETPRIYFRGEIAWDPITTNNDPTFYNETIAESVMSPGETVQAYRESAIQAVPTGLWNPHGTHRTIFYDTEISGADLGDGVITDDPFVGAPVGFLGMLVDCEPYGAWSSQQFFDSMQFGIAGGCQISCARTMRAVARYINFVRNTYNRMIAGVGSAVWQTSFPKAALQLDAHDSPALAALNKAMAAKDVLGLTMRWNTYRTVYYDNPCLRNGSAASAAAAAALEARLNEGGFQPNPARGLIVGVIGLWRKGEPAQEPGDRALLAALPGEVVASAFARVERNRLTIDFGNSFPEVDELLNKQDFGDLKAVAVADDGATVLATLGAIDYHQYDRLSYERASGIVTLRLDARAAKAVAGAAIQIRTGDGAIVLAEDVLRALPTDHNLYLDEGHSAQTLIQVFKHGRPVGAGVQVTMYDGNSFAVVGTANTDADGVASFTMNSIAGGAVEPYVLVAGADPTPPAQLDPQTTPYMYVRTLPADAATAALAPTWDNVYANVLANWNAMAPCMDNWLLLNDEAQVRAYAPRLKQLTDPVNFEAYRFMPVTRDMTPGERTLLYKFLDSPPAAGLETAEAPAPRPRLRNLERMSRAMRSR